MTIQELVEALNKVKDKSKEEEFALENQWVSVEEDLPCNNPNNIHFGFTNNILAIDDNKNIFIAYMKKYKNKEWTWDSSDNPDLSHHITHWMPMPNIWISVDENLPRQDEEVIVLCDELHVAPNYKISFGHIVDKTICKDYNGWNIPNVVYWFPMPKLSNK